MILGTKDVWGYDGRDDGESVVGHRVYESLGDVPERLRGVTGRLLNGEASVVSLVHEAINPAAARYPALIVKKPSSSEPPPDASSPVRAVAFDMDDTLYSSIKLREEYLLAGRVFLKDALLEHGIRLSMEDAVEVFKYTRAQLMEQMESYPTSVEVLKYLD